MVDVQHEEFAREIVRSGIEALGTLDASSLTTLARDTKFVAGVSKAEWVSQILEQTRAWPEDIRPTPHEIHKACSYWSDYHHVRAAEQSERPIAVNAKSMVSLYKDYRKPLIYGVLRVGETMNVIAAPKVGKSWLVLSLALNVSNGNPWLGMDTEKTNVLLVDNELHVETLAQRLRGVAYAQSESLDRLSVLPLRGRTGSIVTYRDLIIQQAKEHHCGLIILDALYRFLPEGTSENDNAAMTGLYNIIDSIASETGASIILIHHSSKGNQGDKSVTDGGAGAGAVSRAADAHVFLREHEEPGHVVFDAVARSWPPLESFVIESRYEDHAKVWIPAPHMDPELIKGRKTEKAPPKMDKVEVDTLLKRCLIPRNEATLNAVRDDIALTLTATKTAVRAALDQAVREGHAEMFKDKNTLFIRAT